MVSKKVSPEETYSEIFADVNEFENWIFNEKLCNQITIFHLETQSILSLLIGIDIMWLPMRL